MFSDIDIEPCFNTKSNYAFAYSVKKKKKKKSSLIESIKFVLEFMIWQQRDN